MFGELPTTFFISQDSNTCNGINNSSYFENMDNKTFSRVIIALGSCSHCDFSSQFKRPLVFSIKTLWKQGKQRSKSKHLISKYMHDKLLKKTFVMLLIHVILYTPLVMDVFYGKCKCSE